jgi:hypothetical protein
VKRTILAWVLAASLSLGLALTALAGSGEHQGGVARDGETYTYVVKKGDTLWDICETLYGDPWVWPKLWQINQHITNPHWIYPGTQLEVYYELPKPEPIPAVVEKPAPAPPAPPPPPRVETYTFERIDQVGFITPARLAGSGVIAGEKTQKYLMGMTDRIYVRFHPEHRVEAGDRYVIFKTSELIRHPITGEDVGYLNTIQGILEIAEVTPDYARAQVLRSYDAITAGERVLPYRKKSEEITLREGTEPREGYIVLAAEQDQRNLVGGRQIVFIDLGENQHIQPGHQFVVFREPTASRLFRRESELVLTAEPVGQLLVLTAQKETAAAVVTRADVEFVPGERIRLVMHD